MDYIKSKSKTTHAIKMFSEGKSSTDVVIDLDLDWFHFLLSHLE